MLWALSLAILVAGVGDLAAIVLGRRPWRYLLKAGTIFLIIALAATGLPEAGLYGYLVLAGLLCSVTGDLFLLLPGDRFLPGLIAFFLAHICYVAAFDAARSPTWEDGAIALALAVLGTLLFRRMREGVVGTGLLVPVLLYLTVISAMVLRAVTTREPLAVAGALLFYLSDGILAWDRFVRPLPRADLAVMSSYFLAQYLIALSVVYRDA